MIACNSLISRMAPWASRFQGKFFEFLRRRAVRAQLVDSHARGGERKRRKRLGSNLSRSARGAVPVETCGLNFSPAAFCTNVDTYSISTSTRVVLSG